MGLSLLIAKRLFLNLDLLTASPRIGLNNKDGSIAQGQCERVSGHLETGITLLVLNYILILGFNALQS